MAKWLFTQTPRKAFHPDRLVLIDKMLRALGEASFGRTSNLNADDLAHCIYELGLDAPDIMGSDLSKALLGEKALDFLTACLVESPMLLRRLADAPEEPGHGSGFGGVSAKMDNHVVMKGTLADDARDLGLASLAVRLHFNPGVDIYPYMMALMEFIHPEVSEIPRDQAPIKFQYHPMRRSTSKPINLALLSDFAEFIPDMPANPASARDNFESTADWRKAFWEALSNLVQMLEYDEDHTRPRLMVDKLLIRLVYDNVMSWLFFGAGVDDLWKKYQPIIDLILEHQGFAENDRLVLARHIWINALSVSPDALIEASCTLDDLLPPVDAVRGIFIGQPLPVFMQGPIGAHWSYDSSYATEHWRGLERVVGKIPLSAVLSSHLMGGEAVTLLLDEDDFGEPITDITQAHKVNIALQSPLMDDLVLNPYQTADAINRIMFYATLLPSPYSTAAIEKMFKTRLETVVQEQRAVPSPKLYGDLVLFVGSFGKKADLLRVAMASETLQGAYAKATAAMLVDIFNINGQMIRRLGVPCPGIIRDTAFSADLGL